MIDKFNIKKRVLFNKYIYIIFLSFKYSSVYSQIFFKGNVYTKDSLKFPIEQVVVLNVKYGNGTLTDFNGQFSLQVNSTDMVIFRKLGYFNDTIRISDLLVNLSQNVISITVYLMPHPVELPGFRLVYRKPILDPIERRKTWSYILDRPKAGAQSPISALYQLYSKKGRELRKIEYLYYEEEKKRYCEKRFSRFMAMRLTGYTGLQLDSFIQNCVPDYPTMIQLDDYTLLLKISNCYRQQYLYKKQ